MHMDPPQRQMDLPMPNSPMRATTRTAVVVATKGRPQALQRLLRVLERQTLPPSLVVVSATEDADLGKHLDTCMPIDVIMGSPGLTIQRNRALDRIQKRCDIVFFFDDDFVPSRYWIERTVRLFDNDSGLAGVSGRVIRDGAPAEAVSWEEADRLVGEADGSDREGSSLSEARDLYGCNMAFRMSAIGTDIRFDERLVLYGWLEDKDFSRIAKKSGRLAKCDTPVRRPLGAEARAGVRNQVRLLADRQSLVSMPQGNAVGEGSMVQHHQSAGRQRHQDVPA